MEKCIEITFNNEEDIIEKYDSNKISHELLNYLIKKAKFVKRNEKIKIIIDNKCQTKINYKELLYDGFKEEYINTLKEHIKNNVLQVIFLILGFFFIFISFKIIDVVWKEVLLIIGWVPIWEMIDLELFSDIRGMKRKKILLKLIDSDIEEK